MTGKTFDDRHLFFKSREPVSTFFFLQITNRQFHLASFVLWNYWRILYNPPELIENIENAPKYRLIEINEYLNVVWWILKKSPIIPQHKTGQINLMAGNLGEN